MVSHILRCRKGTNCTSGGFSLIEVSIALLVCALLLLPAIQLYNINVKALIHNRNDSAVKTATMALTKYALLHGRYPFPASPGDSWGAAAFGHSAVKPGGGWPDCQSGGTSDSDVCSTVLNTVSGNSVLIGTLPFAELNVPITSVLNSNKQQLTYAITESLTDRTTYSELNGSIIVLNSAGNPIYSAPTARSHFVVINHGVDSLGAYGQNGARVAACPTDTNSDDFENCNKDGTFRNNIITGTVQTRFYDGTGTLHFDDYVSERNSTTSGIWSYLPDSTNTELSIRDRVGGNVAIGDCDGRVPCIPVSRLDVYGHGGPDIPAARSDDVLTSRICDRGNVSGDQENTGAYSCVDDYGKAVNAVGADQTTCIGSYCPASVASWNSSNIPPWFTPELILGDPTFGGVPLPEGNNYWITSVSGHGKFHRGNGILCVNDRAMNGVFDYDEACNDTSWISNGSRATLGGCVVAGTYARGITAGGALFCQTPADNN